MQELNPNTGEQGVAYIPMAKARGFTPRLVRDYLKSIGIKFIPQYVCNDCCNIKPLPFDFAVFVSGGSMFLIEVDGQQHYNPVTFGCTDPEISYKGIKKRDGIKTKYCEDNGIYLLRLPYFYFNNSKWKDEIDKTIMKLQSVAA